MSLSESAGARQRYSHEAALADRLYAVRTEIHEMRTVPIGFGTRNGPHRRHRDEEILATFAADLSARMVEGMS